MEPVGRLFPAGPQVRRGARIELRPSTRGPPAGTARRNPFPAFARLDISPAMGYDLLSRPPRQ
ncbi:MAG: hypothetical protein M0C28_14825 [Candidatus Moduliflexus flocculans]|nr:hypothetical protein [Candidatus Moduliflexus flocculans]